VEAAPGGSVSGADSKPMRRQPQIQANFLQAPAIAVFSRFKDLALASGGIRGIRRWTYCTSYISLDPKSAPIASAPVFFICTLTFDILQEDAAEISWSRGAAPPGATGARPIRRAPPFPQESRTAPSSGRGALIGTRENSETAIRNREFFSRNQRTFSRGQGARRDGTGSPPPRPCGRLRPRNSFRRLAGRRPAQ
jgi:hypothetical protein